MDFLFCIPIVVGCPTKISVEGNGPRMCPRCNNPAVYTAKSRTWFEFCFVPLIPMKSKHIWLCNICQWNVPLQQGWEPAVPQAGYHTGPPTWVQQGGPSGWGPPASHAGYQPTYLNQQK